MSSSFSPSATTAPTKGKALVRFGWLVVLVALAYFLVRNVPRYFLLTPKSYGAYFWPKVGWLFPHVVCGLLAAVIGPLQFWPRMRRDYLAFHRVAGRVYVVAVLLGSIAAFGMAAGLGKENVVYGLGLTGLAVAWVVTTGMAFVAIRRKNLLQHQQWMVRSYVVTFAFITFRLGSDLLRAGHVLPDDEREAVLAWGCWAVPLLLAEVAIQAEAVFKRRA